MLDMALKDIERVLYFEHYIVTEPGLTPLKQHQLLSEDDYMRFQDEFGDDSFTAEIGAEAVQGLLKAIDLDKEADQLREELADHHLGNEAQEGVQAPEDHRELHRERQQAGVDDPDGRSR